jgi:hypothetical protein
MNCIKNGSGGHLKTILFTACAVLGLTACQGNNFSLDNIEPTMNDSASVSPSPTPSPTVSPSPSPSPVASWWKPTPGLTIHIQFAGTMDYSKNVSAYDVDVYDTPVEKITALKARGVKVICYFSGGSYEDWRSDAKDFPTSVLGKDMAGWPGEKWLDVRQVSLLMPIMKKRMELAKSKGCDAVDPDNMDGYTNDTGWQGTITYAHQLAYNKAIADQAHALGLSVGLKNDLEQIKDLSDLYDFGINESCMDYNECDYLKGFTVDKNKAVFAIDYNGKSAATCTKAKSIKVDMVFKSRDLNATDAFCD